MSRLSSHLPSILLVIVCLACIGCEAKHPASASSTKSAPNPLQLKLESLATSLTRLPTSDVLYDRGLRDYPIGLMEPELVELLDGEYEAAAVLPLLRHVDAKVRTLALALLFDREEPQYLPEIVALADDDAKTFPNAMMVASITISDPDGEPLEEYPQTVGSIAKAMANFYLKPAGFHYGIEGIPNREPGFAEYWQDRHERENCASWWQVKLLRATTGCTPTPRSRYNNLESLRREIDQLPEVESATTMLFLGSRLFEKAGGPDTTDGRREQLARGELVDVCRKLGRDRLMQFLKGESPSGDPDLKCRCESAWQARHFILRHATELLAKDDAPLLLQIGDKMFARRTEPHAPPETALWRIAAARLDQEGGREPLRTAFEIVPHNPWERAEIIVALWELYGVSESELLLGRFFAAEVACQSSLLEHIVREKDWKLLQRIVADERFDRFDDKAVRTMIRLLAWHQHLSLVPENELERDSEPIPAQWRHIVRDQVAAL